MFDYVHASHIRVRSPFWNPTSRLDCRAQECRVTCYLGLRRANFNCRVSTPAPQGTGRLIINENFRKAMHCEPREPRSTMISKDISMPESQVHPRLPQTVTLKILKTGASNHAFRKLLYDFFTVSSRMEEVRSHIGAGYRFRDRSLLCWLLLRSSKTTKGSASAAWASICMYRNLHHD